MNPETEQILNELGFAKPTLNDLPELQVKFMECQCELWQYTLLRHQMLKEDKLADLSDVLEEEKPRIQKAKNYIFLIHAIRSGYRKKVG